MDQGSSEIDRWLAALRPFSVDEHAARRIFDELTHAYSSPGRNYHNLAHIVDVLMLLDGSLNDANEPAALQLAGWFHDAVYDPRRADNEEASALWAARALEELGLSADIVATTRRLILLTKKHDPAADDIDGKILIDADLGILGASPDRYIEYSRAIRREYDWVPEGDYRAGRSKVLAGFLQRPRIYFTDRMCSLRERQARLNVQDEIRLLDGVPR